MANNKLEVPFSSGRELPLQPLPAGACDTHFHIYDPVNYPYWPGDVRNQPPAEVNAYRLLQQRLGLTRGVIVTPSAYKTDNRCTLAALKEFGQATMRAIVVVDPAISDTELKEMDSRGVRGVRFNFASLSDQVSDAATVIKQMASRIASLHWVMSFWMAPELIVQLKDTLASLPVPLLFDHQGHIDPRVGTIDPAFKALTDLQNEGKAWVDVSGPYIDTQTHDDKDTVALGKAFVQNNFHQVIWGTDWPHTTEWYRKRSTPDDAQLANDLWLQCDQDEVKYRQILVDSPARLFGF